MPSDELYDDVDRYLNRINDGDMIQDTLTQTDSLLMHIAYGIGLLAKAVLESHPERPWIQ